MNDFYTRLQNGETAEDIVAQMTAELNKAEARIKEEEQARIEAEKAKQARIDQRAEARTELSVIIRNFAQWMAKFYPTFGEMPEELEDEETLSALADTIMAIMDLENLKIKVSTPTIKTKFSVKPAEEKDPFAEFFKKFGL